MPPKKQMKKALLQPVDVKDEAEYLAPQPDLIICGHRNMHATGNVLCILEKNHEGNHSDGKYAWSDAAGTPIRKHK